MKKFVLMLAFIMLLSCISCACTAEKSTVYSSEDYATAELSSDWNTYYVPELNLSISTPNTYTTIVHNMPDADPVLQELEEKLLSSERCLLAFNNDTDVLKMIVIDTRKEENKLDYNSAPPGILDYVAEDYYKKAGDATEYEVCYIGGNSYIRVVRSSENYSRVEYFTIIDQKVINIALESSEEITKADKALLADVMNSIILPYETT